MKSAIFLGSFNPPHKGHYTCIKTVINSGIMEKCHIDKILIIPCLQNPNKKESIDFWHRYKMCNRMFQKLILTNKVLVDDIEIYVKPTYTYELIDYINSNKDFYLNDSFFWIITLETLKELFDNKWKHSLELLYDNNFIVLYNNEEEYENFLKQYNDNIKYCLTFIKIENSINYHSTDLRNKVNNNESIEEETNKEVNEYIIENNLYK
jgi:nicotinate-nucleotide adenylyltransferase